MAVPTIDSPLAIAAGEHLQVGSETAVIDAKHWVEEIDLGLMKGSVSVIEVTATVGGSSVTQRMTIGSPDSPIPDDYDLSKLAAHYVDYKTNVAKLAASQERGKTLAAQLAGDPAQIAVLASQAKAVAAAAAMPAMPKLPAGAPVPKPPGT